MRRSFPDVVCGRVVILISHYLDPERLVRRFKRLAINTPPYLVDKTSRAETISDSPAQRIALIELKSKGSRHKREILPVRSRCCAADILVMRKGIDHEGQQYSQRHS